MKINEIIVEALNKNTGTPNADTERGWDQDTYTGHVDPATVQMPDFSGLRQAAQGAKTLGQGFKKGWQGVKKVAGGIQGAGQGLRSTMKQHAGEKETAQAAKYWANKWSEAVGANPAIATDKTALQSFAKKITSNKINPATPTDMSAPGVVKYLTTALGQFKAAEITGQSQTTAPTVAANAANAAKPAPTAVPINPAPGGVAKTPAGIEIPQNVGGGARKEPTPTSQPDPQVQQQALAQGVQIKNQEPIIISTGKGKEYGLDDQGQWIHLASGKIQPETLQAFLSQQHDISLGTQQ